MSVPISKQTFDLEQSYIRSARAQTDVVESEQVAKGVLALDTDLAMPRLSDSQCFESIYDAIIKHISGANFKKGLDAAAAIERGLKHMQKREVDSLETIKGEIEASYQTIEGLSHDIAGQIAQCIRSEATLYQAPEETAVKQWLESFAGPGMA